MATSITIKNPSNTHTLRVKKQVPKGKTAHWEDKNEVAGYIPPGQSLDVWLEHSQQRFIVEEMPS